MSPKNTDPGRSVNTLPSELIEPSRALLDRPDRETVFGTLPAGLCRRFHPGRAAIPLTIAPPSERARQPGGRIHIIAAPFAGITTRVDGIPTHDQQPATHPTKS